MTRALILAITPRVTFFVRDLLKQQITLRTDTFYVTPSGVELFSA